MTTALTLFDASDADVLAPTPGPAHRDAMPTEQAAAEQVAVRSGTQRARVLVALAAAGDKGLTDYEMSLRASICRPHVAGTRRADLQRLGLVVQTDRTRPTDTGCMAVVWCCTDAGRRVAGELAQ